MIGTQEVTLWKRCGVLQITNLLELEEVHTLRNYMNLLAAMDVPTTKQALFTHVAPPARTGSFANLMRQWFNPHLHDEFGVTRQIAARVGRLLRPLLAEVPTLFQDVLMAKNASHDEFPWHQDEPFWPVDTAGGVVVWCALDAIDVGNGGLQLLLESHHGGLGPAIDLYTGQAQPETGSPIPELSTYKRFHVNLSPGDAVLFHPRIWHSSGRNVTGTNRRVWGSSWLPSNARWDKAKAPRHPLCSQVTDGAAIGDRNITEPT